MSDIQRKFRTKNDRVNFCRENGLYYPELPGFDCKYFLQYLTGRKQLLPLGVSKGYSFRYFTKDKLFTKAHLYSFFENDDLLKSYLPDDISVDSMNREYLFAVIAYAKKEVYLQLYNEYKKTIAESNYSHWDDYGLEIDNDMLQKVDKFISSNVPSKEKAFRLSKNSKKINEIKDLREEGSDMEE